jgi:putative membrane protein
MLLTIYIILFATFAINPYDRTTWWVKNIPVLIVAGVLVLTYSSFKFCSFLCYHTIGRHFTFKLVPFDWGNHLLSKLGFDFIIPEG